MDASIDLLTQGASQTARAGALLAGLLGPGDVIGLAGDMGAGKTVFSKGVASGLGLAPREVRSATFTLVERYEGGRLPLVHVDAYRLSSAEDLVALGLDEVLDPEGVAVVEWAPRVLAALPGERIDVALSHEAAGASSPDEEGAGRGKRRLRASGLGARGREIVRRWKRLLEDDGIGAGG